MKKYYTLLLFLLPHVLFAQHTWPEELIITPEKTNFEKTSTYKEVIDFLQSIQKLSKEVKVISMGKSLEGKEIPVAILSKSGIASAEEARKANAFVIYIQGNIHAGEVEGKETVMMLMRDILLGKQNYLLDNQVILFAPIYNTDSNDKMEKGRRPSQEDSPLEVGIRENSQGLDLNRDGIKQEALETQALFTDIITPWDPQVFVDLHTTNGTWHAYSLTWAPSYHYAGEYATYNYTNNVMLPALTESIHKKYGLRLGPYGDYSLSEGWPVKNFYTYNHHPRYLINQFSLRNRMAILSEAFAHERFYQRINSTRAFVAEILEYTHQHAAEIRQVNKKAEDDAVRKVKEQAGKAKKGVRFKMISNEKLQHFLTYDYTGYKKEDGTTAWFRTGNIVEYNDVNYFGQFEATVETTIPSGYIIPAAFANIAAQLKKSGVTVTQLSKSATYSGEVFTIEKFSKAERKFEGHFMATAEGKYTSATRKFKKGDYLITMDQPLTNLILYMLEPQSDDGLITWNFFDDYIEKQGVNNKLVEYPVFKYYKK
ncbi:MAG TPA: M14 family metallopeptidase [Ohtaekwangia sp.]|uniref:M14 family metallopeptidase n=1 Tax=Ohtaekwangia sp. TaxID=2066019 RepID=UPI002F94383C